MKEKILTKMNVIPKLRNLFHCAVFTSLITECFMYLHSDHHAIQKCTAEGHGIQGTLPKRREGLEGEDVHLDATGGPSAGLRPS